MAGISPSSFAYAEKKSRTYIHQYFCEVLMGYTTYENRNEPHIGIHVDICGHLRKHGGKGNGEYHEHKTLNAARNYAQTTGLPIRECSCLQKIKT